MRDSSQASDRTDVPNEGADPAASGRTFRGLTLSPFQVTAVEAIEAGSDVLVSAPTGAGKTLVAEFAILDAVKRGKRCIYTAPIKALSNQKFHDFQADPEIDVGLMTGDVTIRPQAQVLVMTTEIRKAKGELQVKVAARAVDERDDKALSQLMSTLDAQNQEVDGDADEEDVEGMGNVNLEGV